MRIKESQETKTKVHANNYIWPPPYAEKEKEKQQTSNLFPRCMVITNVRGAFARLFRHGSGNSHPQWGPCLGGDAVGCVV